jgi:hypothetical protein
MKQLSENTPPRTPQGLNPNPGIHRSRKGLPIEPEKARTEIVRRDTVKCLACGCSVARKARQQKYCSDRCRQRGHDRSRKAGFGENRGSNLGLEPDTGAPTNPLKFGNEIKGVQSANRGGLPPVFGPSGILRKELFAGPWDRDVSSDGVVTFVRRKPGPTLAGSTIKTATAAGSSSNRGGRP